MLADHLGHIYRSTNDVGPVLGPHGRRQQSGYCRWIRTYLCSGDETSCGGSVVTDYQTYPVRVTVVSRKTDPALMDRIVRGLPFAIGIPLAKLMEWSLVPGLRFICHPALSIDVPSCNFGGSPTKTPDIAASG
jgi:hypothetical protein